MKMYKIKANAEEAKSEVIPNLEKLGYRFHGVILPNCDSVQAWDDGLISTYNNHSEVPDDLQELSKEVLAKMCKPSFNDQLIEVEKARQECLKMDNLKIRVNSEAESKEAQELFFELGYEWYCHGKVVSYLDKPFLYIKENDLQFGLNPKGFHSDNAKEITLPQLRDMVVLKRNDVNDATHIDGVYRFYKSSSDELYYYLDGFWTKFNNNSLLTSGVLKPIEKQMKEYLDTAKNYVYVQSECKRSEDWIEIPDGKNLAYIHSQKKYIYFLDKPLSFTNHQCVWQRPQQPESLPFVDDEKTGIEETSSNEECKDVDPAREHSHYFKDVSHLNEIDVYDILKLFEVTDPCLQHIVKKALCAGGRGHKDLQEDLQDIVDTAIRAVELNK